MDDFYNDTLRQIQYAFFKILEAVEDKNLNAIKTIAKQEFKAINEDIERLKGDKK